jgi:hypothetical protein
MSGTESAACHHLTPHISTYSSSTYIPYLQSTSPIQYRRPHETKEQHEAAQRPSPSCHAELSARPSFAHAAAGLSQQSPRCPSVTSRTGSAHAVPSTTLFSLLAPARRSHGMSRLLC